MKVKVDSPDINFIRSKAREYISEYNMIYD